VNEFVEKCRREWRRLRVPAAVADEMAAELDADLDEADAEGVAPEEVVGDDARAFAVAWAAERGFVAKRSLLRRARVPAAIAASAIIGSLVTVLVVPEHERVVQKPVNGIVLPLPPKGGSVWVQSNTPNPNLALPRVYTGGP
jgi:hypothetical protein